MQTLCTVYHVHSYMIKIVIIIWNYYLRHLCPSEAKQLQTSVVGIEAWHGIVWCNNWTVFFVKCKNVGTTMNSNLQILLTPVTKYISTMMYHLWVRCMTKLTRHKRHSARTQKSTEKCSKMEKNANTSVLWNFIQHIPFHSINTVAFHKEGDFTCRHLKKRCPEIEPCLFCSHSFCDQSPASAVKNQNWVVDSNKIKMWYQSKNTVHKPV